MFSGGFKQMFVTDISPQLSNPTALAKETSGLINSKETKMALLTCGKEREQTIKLLIQNFLIDLDRSS
jgi:hypothetical protein